MQVSRVVVCVFNAFLSCTAITLNSATILALVKPLTLPQTLKTLLLSLAVSDLGTGLLVQPLYIARLSKEIQENTQSQTYTITASILDITAMFLSYASFFGVVALSADRFLAINLHLRYRELVTHKRVVAVVIAMWMSSIILTFTLLKLTRSNFAAVFAAAIEGVCYITTAFFCFKIYVAIRHHSNQIHVLQAQLAPQNGEVIENVERERKAAVGTFYMYLVFLICYVPNLGVWVIRKSTGDSTVSMHLHLYTFTLVFVNSSLNPLIYSWKMRVIRRAIKDNLKNMLPWRKN